MYQGYCGRSAPSLLLIIMLINGQMIMTTYDMTDGPNQSFCLLHMHMGYWQKKENELVIFDYIHYELLVPDSLML